MVVMMVDYLVGKTVALKAGQMELKMVVQKAGQMAVSLVDSKAV